MGVQVPELNACCGISLRTSCLIIFWISVINGILLMCSPNIHGGYKVTSTTSIVGNTTNTVYESGVHADNGEWDWFQSMNEYISYPDLRWFNVVIGAFNVLLSTLGLYGTYKNLYSQLKPYLLWNLIAIVVILFECVFYLFMIVIDSYTFFYRAVVNVIGAVFHVLFWLIVYNHYRALRVSAAHKAAAVGYLS